MTDTVFREKAAPLVQVEKPLTASEQARPIVDAEPPYLDYRQVKSKPYTADYYKLGDTWEDPVGGFPKEIAILEAYFKEKIESGDVANSLSAIKQEIKKLEKLNNVNTEERSLIKIETLAAYVEFLNKTKTIKEHIKHYGTNY